MVTEKIENDQYVEIKHTLLSNESKKKVTRKIIFKQMKTQHTKTYWQ